MKRPSKEQVEREIAALDTLDTKALQARWLELYDRDPPARIRAGLLRLGIAYRLQEKAFGGLKPQTVRLLRKLAAEVRADRVAKRSAPEAPDAAMPQWFATQSPLLSPGTQLMREWNGSTEIVDVIANGFLWRGATYRTLSAVAVAITGTKWSGPKFFGLIPPAPRRRTAAPQRGSATAVEVS